LLKTSIDKSWEKKLKLEFDKDYFKKLESFLAKEYQKRNIYPHSNNIFKAFNASTFEGTKVVIIGQDPYHQRGQAHGLSFSVDKNVKVPPSLKNIFKEIENDLEHPSKLNDGCLEGWASQGVLLLNSILTVEDSKPMAHQNQGWEIFTDKVIEILDTQKENLVFMLWGKPAESKAKNVDSKRHLVLTAPHPSPLSSYRGFFGCKHFSKCNDYLKRNGQRPISW
jgi:uracil-DNA glycosylase